MYSQSVARTVPEKYLRRIRTSRPELQICKTRMDEDGMMNVVVIVNEEWVFRFARSQKAIRVLAYENELLFMIGSQVDVPIPKPVIIHPDLSVYPFLAGQPLYRHTLQRLPRQARNRLMEELAHFLVQLHSISVDGLPRPPGDASAVPAGARQEARYRAIVESVYPHLWKDQIAWVEALFEPVLSGRLDLDAFEPRLIHNDLASYHILYSSAEERLTGILDFGTANVSDPARDWGTLISTYGESLLACLTTKGAPSGDLLERARFYAGAIELEWALLGIQKEDVEMLLVHLGRARDGRLPE